MVLLDNLILVSEMVSFKETPDCLKDEAKRKEMEARVLEIVSKGREYAGQQMTRDARREKILSVCDDLQTLVGERLASMEKDADELKKTVKELSRKVQIESIATFFFEKIQISLLILIQGALLR